MAPGYVHNYMIRVVGLTWACERFSEYVPRKGNLAPDRPQIEKPRLPASLSFTFPPWGSVYYTPFPLESRSTSQMHFRHSCSTLILATIASST